MEKDCREKLEDRINQVLDQLNTLTPGTSEYQKVSETLAVLYKLKTEEDHKEAEIKLKERQEENSELDHERDFAEAQKKNNREKIFSIAKLGLEAAGMVGGYLFYGRWLNKGFKFEETGTITSQFVRSFFRKIEPKK